MVSVWRSLTRDDDDVGWYVIEETFCDVTVVEMLSDADSLSLEDALGAIQPMSADNSDVVNTPPTVCISSNKGKVR